VAEQEPTPQPEPVEPVEPDEPVEAPEPTPDEDEDADEPHEVTEQQAVAFDHMSEGEQAKILDKLDREADRHTKRLQEILLEDALMLLPCELCNPRHAGWVDLKQISDEVKQRVRVMIGDREPVKREHDRYSRRCEACNGEGEVETGSKVSGQSNLPCIDCGSKGWVPVGPERAPGRPAVQVAPAAANGQTTPEPAPVGAPALSPEEQAAYDLLRGRNFAVIAPMRG
jgi:hypothetical protein